MTDKTRCFMLPEQITQQHPQVKIYSDKDEWDAWKKIGDPVVHIELRRWADVLLIAPLSANSLAKISNGQCDNLVVRKSKHNTNICTKAQILITYL